MSECLCGAPAVHNHHVVYRQHIRKRGGDENDPRVFLPLCYDCHRRHHSRHAVISRKTLPESAVEFAEELLGDAAGDYLRRYYA